MRQGWSADERVVDKRLAAAAKKEGLRVCDWLRKLGPAGVHKKTPGVTRGEIYRNAQGLLCTVARREGGCRHIRRLSVPTSPAL
jgi:hypothetical protein